MMLVYGHWVIKSLAEKMTEIDDHGSQKSVPRNHKKGKPHNCIRQAHTCYLSVGSCRQARVRHWLSQPIPEAWQHINKEAYRPRPTVYQAPCWPSGHFNTVQICCNGQRWKYTEEGHSFLRQEPTVSPFLLSKVIIKLPLSTPPKREEKEIYRREEIQPAERVDKLSTAVKWGAE